MRVCSLYTQPLSDLLLNHVIAEGGHGCPRALAAQHGKHYAGQREVPADNRHKSAAPGDPTCYIPRGCAEPCPQSKVLVYPRGQNSFQHLAHLFNKDDWSVCRGRVRRPSFLPHSREASRL
ncbi:jg9838 [Pararge aegeria aegeria]|uniref:Jg9838 protein n=1 Tax=Pararge aegeria aegeria TaxID=348720 RepID=A0A8S4RQV0_9NEOP|nr:jg9838 [Pararge aegeria aegeria]